MKSALMILFLYFSGTSFFVGASQQEQLTGVVTDAATGEPMQGLL